MPGPRESNGGRPVLDRTGLAEAVAILGGMILFLALIYELHAPPVDGGFLNPPLIAAAGLILLWPVRRYPVVRALMLSAGLLLLLWFMARLSLVLAPFVVVYLLAFLFDPLVSYLHARRGIPRAVSSLAVTALLLGAFFLVIFLLIPSIVNQLDILAGRLLGSVSGLREWLLTTPLLDQLEETGVIDKNELIARLSEMIEQQADALTDSIPEAARQIVTSITSFLGTFMILTVTPVVHYYTLKDYPFIKRRLVELFPTFGGRRDYLVEAGGIVGNYLRGQLTISAIAAFNVSVALIILDVPFALLIGIIGGVLNMVPNLGIIITHIIGLLVALVFGDPWYVDALIIAAVLFGQGLIEQSILTPNILSHAVSLHPVLIILALFVFGYFLGLFGLLIAVPATALMMTIYKANRERMTLELASDRASDRGGQAL